MESEGVRNEMTKHSENVVITPAADGYRHMTLSWASIIEEDTRPLVLSALKPFHRPSLGTKPQEHASFGN